MTQTSLKCREDFIKFESDETDLLEDKYSDFRLTGESNNENQK